MTKAINAELGEIRDRCEPFNSCGFSEVALTDFVQWAQLMGLVFASKGVILPDFDLVSVQTIFADWMKLPPETSAEDFASQYS